MRRVQIAIRPGKEFFRELLARMGMKYSAVYIISGRVFDSTQDKPTVSARAVIASAEQARHLGISDIEERLDRNDVCFLALVDEKVAGYAWLNMSNEAYIPEVELHLFLHPDEAYQYDAYVSPPFRRHNLHKLLITARLDHLKKHGYKKVYGFISASNIVSLKSVRSFGYVAKKKIRFLRILFFRKRWETLLKEDFVDYV